MVALTCVARAQEVFGTEASAGQPQQQQTGALTSRGGTTAQHDTHERWNLDRVLALAQPGGLDLDSASCLDALRHNAVTKLLRCAQDERCPRQRRNVSALALIRLLRTASMSFCTFMSPVPAIHGLVASAHVARPCMPVTSSAPCCRSCQLVKPGPELGKSGSRDLCIHFSF